MGRPDRPHGSLLLTRLSTSEPHIGPAQRLRRQTQQAAGGLATGRRGHALVTSRFPSPLDSLVHSQRAAGLQDLLPPVHIQAGV